MKPEEIAGEWDDPPSNGIPRSLALRWAFLVAFWGWHLGKKNSAKWPTFLPIVDPCMDHIGIFTYMNGGFLW